MASGTGAQIAITKTSSLTDPASTDSDWNWTNFVSESIEHTLEELEEGALAGRRDAPDSHKGIDFGAGDIALEPNPNALGHFMLGAFGVSSGAVLTQAGSTGTNSGDFAGLPVVQHTFTPRAAAHDSRTFLEPFGIMVYKDVGSAFLFNGAILPGITFNFQAGQLMNSTVQVMARDVTRMERTTAIGALATSGGRPWIWDQASVEVGPGVSSLAVNGKFEALEVSLETPHEGVVLLDGTKKYAEFQPNDFRRVNISGTMTFRDHAEYDDYVAYASQYMRITAAQNVSALTLGNPSSAYYFELQLEIPQLKYLSWSTPIGGPNRLTTTFTAKGEYNSALGYNILGKLTNIHSAY